jgi:hypothetical protein
MQFGIKQKRNFTIEVPFLFYMKNSSAPCTRRIGKGALLSQGVYQFGQTGNIARGVGAVDHTFRSGGIDDGNGGGEGFLGAGVILGRDRFANPLYESPQGGADVLVPVSFLLVLFDSLQCRFMVCQVIVPPCIQKND